MWDFDLATTENNKLAVDINGLLANTAQHFVTDMMKPKRHTLEQLVRFRARKAVPRIMKNLPTNRSAVRFLVGGFALAAIVGTVGLLAKSRVSPSPKLAASDSIVVFSVPSALPDSPIRDVRRAVPVPLWTGPSYPPDEPLDTTVTYAGDVGLPPSGGVAIPIDGSSADGVFTLYSTGIGLQISGSTNKVMPAARVASGVSITGAGNKILGPLEYVTTLTLSGGGNSRADRAFLSWRLLLFKT